MWGSTSRMLKKSASGVLSSRRGSTYGTQYDSPLRSLRPCWTAFLSILRERSLLVPDVPSVRARRQTGRPSKFCYAEMVFSQPARYRDDDLAQA